MHTYIYAQVKPCFTELIVRDTYTMMFTWCFEKWLVNFVSFFGIFSSLMFRDNHTMMFT